MQQTFTIQGMSCASCARHVESAALAISGVKSANVNLAAEKLLVETSDSQTTAAMICEAVSKAGYKAEAENSDRSVTIAIGGMSCTACAQRIEKSLQKLDGVTGVSVNYAAEKAYVSYNPGKIRVPAIKQTIVDSGYTPLESESEKGLSPLEAQKLREEKITKIKLLVAAVFTIPLFYIAMAPMISWLRLPFPEALAPMRYPLIYALLQISLVIPVVAAGYRFYLSGTKAALHGAPNMDSLVAMGTGAALIYSIFSTVKITNGSFEAVEHLYFETAAVIITLILLGKMLESRAKGKTSQAIKRLMNLAPQTAIVLHDGREVEIGIDEVLAGDTVIVKPGSKIPVDGVIIEGRTSVDESMLTGESIPVERSTGQTLRAASVNGNGMVKLRAERVGEDTMLAQIIRMVESAQGSKAPVARLAGKVAGYFVPIVVVIALVAAAAWFISGESFTYSLSIFITVLVIACPCALGLATPTAIMVGTGKGAENGILIKSGEALEIAHNITSVVFDKTGTITEGKPAVTDISAVNGFSEDQILAVAASAEKGSEHPLADAIVEEAARRSLPLLTMIAFAAIPGHGIEATIDQKMILLGNQKLMDDRKIDTTALNPQIAKFASEGKTAMYIAIDNRAAGIIAVADIIKESSRAAVAKLHALGIDVVMITGDHKVTAEAVARAAGIDRVIAEVLPQGKAAVIEAMQKEGRLVAMVGDGINDAIALAQADIGIAIGNGTDVAKESAGIVLMRGDLKGVADAINLSRKTMRTIKQNLFWAFGYNVLGIPIAAGVLAIFGGPLLSPMIAAAAMSFSSVSVVTNALRLKGFKVQ